jgi:lysophospholipase L1-like esterase
MLPKGKALLRYLGGVTAISTGLLVLIEIAGWAMNPARYQEPPPVTEDTWLGSDGLAPGDSVWMREYVDEFCRSYRAHWKSYVYYSRYPFRGKYINVDSNSIRYTPQYASPNTVSNLPLRIFLFGGSTMWGTGARDAGTIPSSLSRIIASKNAPRPVQITNMGESGYVSTQELIRLELELRQGNIPDLVILYDGANDIYGAYLDAEPGLPQNEVNRVMEFNLLKEKGRMLKLGIENFLSRTVTADFVSGIRSSFLRERPWLPTRLEAAGGVVHMYKGNLKLLEALSREYGFDYEAFWQPVVFERTDPSPYEQKQSEMQKPVRPLFLDVYHRIAEDPDLRANHHFHDISGLFNGTGAPVYIDFLHITERGNSLVAQRMYEDLRGVLAANHSPR